MASDDVSSALYEIERSSGIALWRQIADILRAQISAGVFANGGAGAEKLPTEMVLAEQFGVNRHTLRAAISYLVEQKVLRTEQGRGTFINTHRRLVYPISQRTRFSAGVATQSTSRRKEVLSSALIPATEELALRLQLKDELMVQQVETLSIVDDQPVALAKSWFGASKYSGIEIAIKETGSITKALSAFGVQDYVRANTQVEARLATSAECKALSTAQGTIVLAVESLNTDPNGTPVEAGFTCFLANRTVLSFQPS